MKIFSFSLLFLTAVLFPLTVSAHSIWIEREEQGDARVYFGEWLNNEREKTGEALDKIQSTRAFSEDASKLLSVTRESDHIKIASAGQSGDIRFVEDGLKPREDKAGKGFSRSVYYARVGRSDIEPRMDFELVPVAINGNEFTLLFGGHSVPDTKVNLASSHGWEKSFKTDSEGRVTFSLPWKGQYLAQASHVDENPGEKDGQAYDRTRHVATLFFTTDSIDRI